MGAGRVGVLRAAVGPLAAPRPPLPGTVTLCWALPLADLFWLALGWILALAWGKLGAWGRL
jgi:hypothetical protein